MSDLLGRRKPMVVGGYFLTGASKALFAFAYGLPLLLVGRTLAWFGRGLRSPLRDAMLANSVPAEARGKAFGFHRAGDTLGAIIRPLLGVWLLSYLHPQMADPSEPFRVIFLLTLVSGLGSGVAFGLWSAKSEAPSQIKFWTTIRALPRPFWRFLWGVGTFGMGDFARTLLIIASTQLLIP
ncbi:MAG: MFS transporter [Terriglobia bacterium]